MGIHVITDTSCDLPLAYVKGHRDNLTVLGMPVELNGQGYVDDLGETFEHDFFYEQLKVGAFPATSQINPMVYEEAFEKHVKQGDLVLVIGLSSGLSATIEGAQLAKKNVLAHYPEAQIEIIDTLAASIGLGHLVYQLLLKIHGGMPYEHLIAWVQEEKLKVNHWFAIDDLMHLKKGGRIPASTAYIGTMLKVKPILTVNHHGKLGAFSKVRGRNKSIHYLLEQTKAHLNQNEKPVIMVGHAACQEDAIQLETMILDHFPEATVVVSQLSQTIGTHVGPGMLAVAFTGRGVRENCIV